MSGVRAGQCLTTSTIYFNNPENGQTIEVPPGEPCMVVETIAAARAMGRNIEAWVFERNIKAGYIMVLIRGEVRGVRPEHLSQVSGIPSQLIAMYMR